jgi:hypothetical protein
VKRRFAVGSVWDVTNHYLEAEARSLRADPSLAKYAADVERHPSFGTTRRTVLASCASSVTFAPVGGHLPFPRAAQIEADADGTVRFFGGGAGQEPDELCLTLRPVPA